MHRLREELREAETETTPFLAMSGIAVWVALLIAFVIALVFVVARLAG